MTILPKPPFPYRLAAASAVDAGTDVGEIAVLQRLRDAGIAVAPTVVVPPEAEERFYRLNNLPDRLVAIFAGVDPTDPDEDDLEELAPEAAGLLEQHFLLDEIIDAFYERLEGLPDRVRVRRPGHAGVEVVRGRPALLAVKRLWAADWSFEALVARLAATRTFALEARPVLVHGVDGRADPGLTARVRDAAPAAGTVWSDSVGRVTRVAGAHGGPESGTGDDGESSGSAP